jgi:uncharacterized membrane protein
MQIFRTTTRIHSALVLLTICLFTAVTAIDIDITDVGTIRP